MQKWLRRIRGAIGMGFTWGAACFVAGSVPRWVFGINTDVPIPLVFGVFGFSAGIIFSALLALIEGRHRFDELSHPRVAGWGAIGGVLLAAVFALAVSLGRPDVLVVAPTFAVACAVCASGSLALARRAVRRELPDRDGDTAEAPLTDHELRELRRGGE